MRAITRPSRCSETFSDTVTNSTSDLVLLDSPFADATLHYTHRLHVHDFDVGVADTKMDV